MNPSSPIRRALLTILCHGRIDPLYERGYVGWGTPGFFSMLNSLADEVMVHAYRGERPSVSWSTFYNETRFIGYGNVSLGSHFKTIACPVSSTALAVMPHDAALRRAVETLHAAPRHTVASHVVHLLFTARRGLQTLTGHPPPTQSYALAIHLRRGDKLREGRNSEKIAVWDDTMIVEAAAKALQPGQPSRRGASVASGGAGRRILLASDDNAFAKQVEAALRRRLGVEVDRPLNEHDAGVTAPFDACDATCIPPLQSLMAAFGHSSQLMVSSKSNMGSFMITYWQVRYDDDPL